MTAGKTSAERLVAFSDGVFAGAACVAYWHPPSGFALVCCVLLIYLRPQVPGEGLERHPHRGHSRSIRLPQRHAKEETL
jgi:hypothetical protein